MNTTSKLSTLRRSSIIAAAVALTALSLTACSQGASGSGSHTIEIAASSPLTGDSAAYGVGTMNGIELAIDEINKAGGVDGRKLKLSKFDDKCKATTAATAANKIISNTSFVAVIGNVCSSATLAQLPIFKRVNLPVVDATASSPELSAQGYAGFTRIIPNDDIQGAATIKLAADALDLKRIAVLYPSDDYGQSLYQIAERTVKKYGATIVAAETYVTGSTNDFSAQLSNIAAKNPDALFLAGYYADMGTAVKQSVRSFSGKKIALVANAQDQNPQYVSLAGDAGNGTYVTNVYDIANPSKQNQDFVKAFKAKFDKEPGVQAACGYDNVYVLKAALEKTHGSKDGLAAALRKVDYTGAMGRITFNDKGDNVGGAMVALQLQDGEWRFQEELTEKLTKK